tara:strand:+ start:9916 stop:10020 length:105 start_codon:yes stop_codon:yes gene_type:complete
MLTANNLKDLIALAVFAAGALYGLPVIIHALIGV